MGISDWLGFSQIIALVLGASWTYILFVQKRQRYPRLSLVTDIVFVPSDQNKQIIRVQIHSCNIGEVLVRIQNGFARAYQLLPTKSVSVGGQQGSLSLSVTPGFSDVAWPILSTTDMVWEEPFVEIEPHETHEFLFDFIFDESVDVVAIHCHFGNETRDMLGYPKQYGWSNTTHVDLKNQKLVTSARYEPRPK